MRLLSAVRLALAVALVLAANGSGKPANAAGGHRFESGDGNESIEMLDGRTAEVVFPGASAPKSGRYETIVEGDRRRLVVDFGGGAKAHYRLVPGGLLSERTGQTLRLGPPPPTPTPAR